tara:strand:- start:325 stop:1038 length:714 start_codon:yes stop_codon:yes gene_type:complete
MVCSYCNGSPEGGHPTHNRRTCILLAQANQGGNPLQQYAPPQAAPPPRAAPPPQPVQDYNVHHEKINIYNDNAYGLSVYHYPIQNHDAEELIYWKSIPPFGGIAMQQNTRENTQVIIFPCYEIMNEHGVPRETVPIMEIVDLIVVYEFLQGPDNRRFGDDRNFYLLKEYQMPKSELDKWKECGLKSMFLLQEIIRLGGMKHENLEPILDLVQDIHIPNHEAIDRERAGVPSTLTNIT